MSRVSFSRSLCSIASVRRCRHKLQLTPTFFKPTAQPASPTVAPLITLFVRVECATHHAREKVYLQIIMAKRGASPSLDELQQRMGELKALVNAKREKMETVIVIR